MKLLISKVALVAATVSFVAVGASLAFAQVTSTANFSRGDKVVVVTKVNVRSKPIGIIAGKQLAGAAGTLMGGPANANDYTWWKIDYNDGVDGWTAEDFLQQATAAMNASAASPAATATTQASGGVGGGTCPKGASFLDGCAGAPSGTAQHPALLDGYATRPPWNVAGVDYAVGIPTGTVLKDWQTISQMGVSVDTTNNTVYLSGNNVTLNAIDFSLHGGAQLVITGSNDTISNSNFVYGPSMLPDSAVIAANGSNATIENCVIDGNGPTLGAAIANQTSLINGSNKGVMTILYNVLKNFNQHAVEANGSGGLNYQYNLIENGGSGAAGAHVNFLQFGGATGYNSVTVQFNTTYLPTIGASGGEGFQMYNNGTGNINGTLAYNTIVNAPDGSGRPHIPGTSGKGVTTANVHDNYIDKKGSQAWFYHDANAGTLDIYTSNIDLRTGKTIIVTRSGQSLSTGF
jgi:hypothetical protein